MTQHNGFDGEVHVTATDELDALEDAAERPVEEGGGYPISPCPRAFKVQLAGHGWPSRHGQDPLPPLGCPRLSRPGELHHHGHSGPSWHRTVTTLGQPTHESSTRPGCL